MAPSLTADRPITPTRKIIAELEANLFEIADPATDWISGPLRMEKPCRCLALRRTDRWALPVDTFSDSTYEFLSDFAYGYSDNADWLGAIGFNDTPGRQRIEVVWFLEEALDDAVRTAGSRAAATTTSRTPTAYSAIPVTGRNRMGTEPEEPQELTGSAVEGHCPNCGEPGHPGHHQLHHDGMAYFVCYGKDLPAPGTDG
jgi:hypothetical protein